MITFPKSRKIYIRPGHTDLRKSINGLSLIAQQFMGQEITSGNYFIFCNRNRKLMKIVYWDKNGFCLWLKRLEESRFPWPSDEAAIMELTTRQITWLLQGIDFFHAHKQLYYKTV